MSTIKSIITPENLKNELKKSSSNLAVIDFHADWCGPCRAIAPTYEKLSEQYKNITFLKCNVDHARDVAAQFNITAMPTFKFLRDGEVVDELRGADPRKLEGALRKLSSDQPSGTFTGKGQRLGSSDSPSTSSDATAPGVGENGLLANMSPQSKMLAGLVAAYVVLWYFRS